MNKGTTIIKSPELGAIPWLFHGTTTKRFNPAPGNKPEEIKYLAEFLNIQPAAFLYGEQRHTNHVHFVEKNNARLTEKIITFTETDAVGTNCPGILTMVYTADCVPILLLDTVLKQFMLIHAGWRGSYDGISCNAVETLKEHGSKPENLMAWIGPAIGVCCYEVSSELVSRFRKKFPEAPDIVKERHLNLKVLNAFQLEKSGISRNHIHVCSFCTKCRNDLFHSYRAEGNSAGRILSFAFMR